MLIRRSRKLAVASLVIAFGLGGCGGDDTGLDTVVNPGYEQGSGAGPTGGSTGAGASAEVSPFINRVMEIIATTADDTEPVSIEAITVDASDTAEPVPVTR